MSKFNARSLVKFLTRTPEKDFSDDGTRFAAYSYKDLFSVSYTSYKGTIYLAGDEPKDIPYEFVRNYHEFTSRLAKFNGIDKDDPELTMENIQKTFDEAANILIYDIQPAWEQEKNVVMTDENISKVKQLRKEYARNLIDNTTELVSKINFQTILRLTRYDIESVKDYYNTIMRDYSDKGYYITRPVYYNEVKKAIANNFQPIDKWDDLFSYKQLKEILGKVVA